MTTTGAEATAEDRTGARSEPVVLEYLTLGLRLGRHIDGFVDCWFGDPSLRRQVAAEALTDPGELADHAATARRTLLPDSGLAEPRQRFLAAQLGALEGVARRLAGAQMPFTQEVRTYFEVEVELGDPDRYAGVHDAINELLPGAGTCQSKVEAFYARNVIAPDRLLTAVRAVSDELRARVRPLFELPESERVTYEVVADKPWNAFNQYFGGFRSTVSVNVHAGRTIAVLPHMVTHESYPGHHSDHCVKEALLVNDAGQDEHAISLVNTPQCLVSEGAAEHAITAVLGQGWGAWTAELLAEHGVAIEGELVERMLGLVTQLLPVRQDAAILLHDRGADEDGVVEYLRRWLLLPRDRAEQIVRFLTDPLWRAYSVTYIEGRHLVGAWLAARPAGQPVHERYRRLLREPLLPSMLIRDLARAEPA